MKPREILVNMAANPSELAGQAGASIPMMDPLRNWARDQLARALTMGFPHAHPANIPGDRPPANYRRLAPGVHIHADASAAAERAADDMIADTELSAAAEAAYWADRMADLAEERIDR